VSILNIKGKNYVVKFNKISLLPFVNPQTQFLKDTEYPNGLELDIYYPQYGFTIESTTRNITNTFFHNGDLIILLKDQLKKELCEEIGFPSLLLLCVSVPFGSLSVEML